MISLIVARAENNVIGSRNDLPWYLPADLKRFRELTTHHTVVMGRRTYDSIVERLGHALPERRNIVLTRQSIGLPDAEIVHNVEMLKTLGKVFVIGGEQVYNQTIHMADKLYVTEVKADIPGDARFPHIDSATWQEVSREPHTKDDRNEFDYDFVVYERVV